MLVSPLGHVVSSQKTLHKQEVAFKGHNLVADENGQKNYHFYLPKVAFDKAELQVKKFYLDENGNIDETIDVSGKDNDLETPVTMKKGQYEVKVPVSQFKTNDRTILGYRFIIDGTVYNDTTDYVKYNGKIYNVAENPAHNVVTTAKTMYHIMPAIFTKLPEVQERDKNKYKATNILEQECSTNQWDIASNPFTRADGNLQGIVEQLPHLQSMGVKRILSTPFFGQDELSSHKYWTTNPFQITSDFGTMQDYKNMQIELFKKGMGILADGAFVNEGLEGIHIRDILLHGDKSPFINWFDIDPTFPQEPLHLGVLPVDKKAYENFDIRIVNSPYIWDVQTNGTKGPNFGITNPQYEYFKPTYIQIYDKRLVTKEDLESKDLIRKYKIKSLHDKEEISTWMDSVQPYAFPVNASSIGAKVKSAKQSSSIPLKEFLRDWDFYTLETADKSGGIKLWNGNKDVAKLIFTLPETKIQQIYDTAESPEAAEEKIAAIKKANQETREYLASIGAYWTNKTAKILTEHIMDKFGENTRMAKDYKRDIDAMIAQGVLPKEAKNITTDEIEKVICHKYIPVERIPGPETMRETLMSVPFETVEVSNDITSIFTSPNFKKLAERNLFADGTGMEYATFNIFSKLTDADEINGITYLQEQDLSPLNLKLVRLLSDDLLRFLIVKALNPKMSMDDIFSGDIDKLKTISLRSVGVTAEDQREKAAQLVGIMRKNLNKLSKQDFEDVAKYFAKKYGKTNVNRIRVAEFILDKTQAGLEWRIDAAKDVAEIDAVSEDEAGLEETWKEAISIWKNFNKEVVRYNPHAYIIGEITDSGIDQSNITDEFPNGGVLEKKFTTQTGFTSTTNYNFFFSALQSYFGGMAEDGKGGHADAKDLLWEKLSNGWADSENFLSSGSKNNVIYSHVAVGNQDKPRITDGFCINTRLGYMHEIDDNVLGEIADDFMLNSTYYKKYIKDMYKKDHESKIKKIDDNDKFQNIKKQLFEEIEPLALAKEAAMLESVSAALNNDNRAKLLEPFTKILDAMASKHTKSGYKFGKRSFDFIYDEAVKKIDDEQIRKEFDKLKPEVHRIFTQFAVERGTEMAKLMVALPGNPTFFAGDELLETGGEDKAKNNDLQNRNVMHWERLTDSRYKHVQDYKNELAKILALRSDKDLSCLVNGDTIPLKCQENKIMGFYRYNNENDAIIITHNKEFDNLRRVTLRNDKKQRQDTKEKKERIKISHVDMSYYSGYTDLGRPFSQGLVKQLPEGTKFVDALNPSKEYFISADGNLRGPNDSAIDINDDAVLILKRA